MERKELFKETVSAGRRIYVVDVKETKDGSKYLSITEFDPANKEGQNRKIMVFEDHLDDFQKGLEKAFNFLKPPAKIPTKISSYIQGVRETHPRAYEQWSSDEDENLRLKFSEGLNTKELSTLFQRKEGSIRSRLKKLGLKS